MRNGFYAARRTGGALAAVLAFTTPAWAQDGVLAGAQHSAPETAIDALIDASISDEGAIATAGMQADGGDLIGAAATLERAMLMRPAAKSDGIRLYYAGVLCRLDDRRRAAYQLGNVTDAAAPGWAAARAACGDIGVAPPPPRRSDGVWGEVSAGLAYDGDAFGALATELDLPTVPRLADDGLSVTTGARIDARFGTRDRSYFFGGLSFLSKDSIDGPRLDYQVGGARLGFATMLGGNADISLGGVIRHARLLNDPFVTEYGGQASFGLASGESGHWSLDAEVVDQDYRGGAFQSLRDGMRYDLALGYQQASAANRSWTAGIAIEAKDAGLRTLGYRGGRVFAATLLPIAENGTYLGLSATARRVDYRDPAVGADLKEWRLFGRAAVGVPLGPKGLFIEAAGSYTARLYNDAGGLRDYDSFGAELRLVYRFGK